MQKTGVILCRESVLSASSNKVRLNVPSRKAKALRTDTDEVRRYWFLADKMNME